MVGNPSISRHLKPNVFTINSGVNFFAVLVDALVNGELIDGYSITKEKLDANPFCLFDVTLYVPTRRAIKQAENQFSIALAKLLGQSQPAILLPQIRAIGDSDEADLLVMGVSDNSSDAGSDLLPALPDLDRQIALTHLVWQWSRLLVAQTANLSPTESIIIPANPGDAARLAQTLASLLDEAESFNVDWQDLEKLVPEDFAHYWQLSLSFLKIITKAWPEHLAEISKLDAMTRRNRLILNKAALLASGKVNNNPIIAAGSTGSVPATTQLLKSIANHPRGCVVLPGLDQDLDENSWNSIGSQHSIDGINDPASIGHPQFALKQTLKTFGISRSDVRSVFKFKPSIQSWFLNQALRPADETDAWLGVRSSISPMDIEAIKSQFTIIETKNQQEEATSIALAIRHFLSSNEGGIALVTPDRNLARRVSAELKRYGLMADDSAGQPLFNTPAGKLSRLIIECVQSNFDPVCLLSLLKHPLAGFGQSRHFVRTTARLLERAIFRAGTLPTGLDLIAEKLQQLRKQNEEGKVRLSHAQSGLSDKEWFQAENLLRIVQNTFNEIAEQFTTELDQPISYWARYHRKLLSLVIDGEDTKEKFETSNDGDTLFTAIDEVISSSANEVSLQNTLEVSAFDYADVLSALIGSRPVRPKTHASEQDQVHILGTLEARLLHFDCLVLGGLNEKSWPGEVKLDPWLSRNMRAKLGLPLPEKSIGLSAHDFVQLASQSNVVLTRAISSGGAPTRPARWLERLKALLGDQEYGTIVEKGNQHIQAAKSLDTPSSIQTKPASRPYPKPNLALRPKKLSVTEIEKLIRDPYAIYARHVLKLRPFEALAAAPNFADRGLFIHEILDRFVAGRNKDYRSDAAGSELSQIANEVFAKIANHPEPYASWRTRFDKTATWMLNHEDLREPSQKYVEQFGKLNFPDVDFTLTGRTDRFDIFPDGTVELIDYKTGAPPSIKQINSFLAPQLPLEALMYLQGAFHDLPAKKLRQLSYIQLSGGNPAGKYTPVLKSAEDAIALCQATLERFTALLKRYEDETIGYLSQARPMLQTFSGDYDHLARVFEWQDMEEEGAS